MQQKIKQYNNNEPLIPYINKPGIALSFDDGYRVKHWYKYGKELFGFYDVRVTFNINAFHPFENERELSQEEINMLLELQSLGHEIAHHGYKHKSATNYTKQYGLEKWINEEIINLINWMSEKAHFKTNEKFKKPLSFAFPFSDYNESVIKKLIPNYFKIVRGHLGNDNLTQFKHNGFAPSICIDRVYLTNVKYLKKIIRDVKNTGMNLIIMCHSILPDKVKWEEFGWGNESRGDGLWRTSRDTLKTIINEARENDLEFYTTSEIAGVATFIDSNFERFVIENIIDSSDKWISIADLIPIKTLDISNQNISSLDGIQYFLNLEEINIKNNQILDLRLLNKLPKLIHIEK